MNRYHAHKSGQVMISWFLGYFLTWVTEGEGVSHEVPTAEVKPINLFFLPMDHL